jgi:DNA-binding response OmpR family regulator
MTSNHIFTKILLVSDNKVDVGDIKNVLEKSINFECYIWHCPTLEDAINYLDKRKLRVQIIILDLGLNNPLDSKKIYDAIGIAAQKIPIIVLTGSGKEDRDLATYVMEAGASDRIVRGQFNRLIDAIEFSLIRHKIAIEVLDKGSHDLEDSQNGHDIEMIEAKRKSDQKNNEKNQYISWVMGSYSVEENHTKKSAF